ncbi:MAG: PF20097 family protein [Saccharofermentans sp.]|nr:PF20097 family protein [Saccharofermentans sp.]
MICRKCGRECKKGIIETHERGNIDFLDFTPAVIRWIPEEEQDKFFRKNKKTYEASEGTGFYCEACDTMYAEFEHPTFEDRSEEEYDE